MASACDISVGDFPTAGSVSISPTASSIGVGYHQAYELTVHDTNGKLLPNAARTFSISPDGSCTSRVCSVS
jgi:hypothetical protein